MKGREKLGNSVVTVVGCGGLGAPALVYLAEAGVGTIRMVDGDMVSESNLNRQFLYWEEDIGKKKADLAAKKLKKMNPQICVERPFMLFDRRKCRSDSGQFGYCRGLCGQC